MSLQSFFGHMENWFELIWNYFVEQWTNVVTRQDFGSFLSAFSVFMSQLLYFVIMYF